MAAAARAHPIFGDIRGGDLEAVKSRVLADPAVLEERYFFRQRTPLIYAICNDKPTIALWLIDHRAQHDVNAKDGDGETALHWACRRVRSRLFRRW